MTAPTPPEPALIAEYVSPILAVPQPVRRKKRVSKTVYWEECPKCGNKLGHDSKGQLVSTSWFQDTRLDPPERTYLPCYCTVRAGEQIDGSLLGRPSDQDAGPGGRAGRHDGPGCADAP